MSQLAQTLILALTAFFEGLVKSTDDQNKAIEEIKESLALANNGINDEFTRIDSELETAKEVFRDFSKRLSLLEGNPTPDPDPDPDPLPDLGTAEMTYGGKLIVGQKTKFECRVTTYFEIERVLFFFNGLEVKTEFNEPYEADIEIPNATSFQIDSTVILKGTDKILETINIYEPEAVTVPDPDPTPDPDPDPTPVVPIGIEKFDDFLAKANRSWYDFDASTTTIPDGFVSESIMKTLFNASDAFIGMKYQDSRFKFESAIPEMGEKPGLLLFTPTGAKGANYQERVSVPKTKDRDFTPSREVAVIMDYFTLDPGQSKTGNVAEDIRTYYPEPHVKRMGLTTYLEQPGPGSNPGAKGEGCEFVLLSQYGPDTFNNNFPYGNKGDLYGKTLPQGFTTFDLSGELESFDPNSTTYLKDRTIFAVGVYAHDVTDYNYQSQIFPCYPGTNIRLTVPHGEEVENRFLIGLNTVSNGKSNNDGYFYWWMRVPSINNGEWFLAAKLENRNFTGDVAMMFANLGIGQYNGGQGKGYYLNDGKTANGIWFTKMAVHHE